jgi:hypothetical protein
VARLRTSAIAAALITAGAVAGSATAGLGQSASGTISNNRASTRPVTLTLKLGYEMQCGYPGPGPVVVTFPATWRLPAKLGATPVLVNGKAAVSASLSGHTVKVGLAAPPQIICDEIGPGMLTVQFTRGDNIGSPLKAGTSVVTAQVKGQTFNVSYAFSAA